MVEPQELVVIKPKEAKIKSIILRIFLLTANSEASSTVSICRPSCCRALSGSVAGPEGSWRAWSSTSSIWELDYGEQGECSWKWRRVRNRKLWQNCWAYFQSYSQKVQPELLRLLRQEQLQLPLSADNSPWLEQWTHWPSLALSWLIWEPGSWSRDRPDASRGN